MTEEQVKQEILRYLETTIDHKEDSGIPIMIVHINTLTRYKDMEKYKEMVPKVFNEIRLEKFLLGE